MIKRRAAANRINVEHLVIRTINGRHLFYYYVLELIAAYAELGWRFCFSKFMPLGICSEDQGAIGEDTK